MVKIITLKQLNKVINIHNVTYMYYKVNLL